VCHFVLPLSFVCILIITYGVVFVKHFGKNNLFIFFIFFS
jgi:hypothetical protein